MVDWQQIGEDFRQKYEGTYCRYISPISQNKEVFYVSKVRTSPAAPPSLTLVNKAHGEIYLSWDTEAELDFAFPRCGYFQSKDKALLFARNYERQYKKGVCHGTATFIFPYPNSPWAPSFDEETVAAAFKDVPSTSISSGIEKLNNGKFSVALSRTFALGLGKHEKVYWLWHETQPVAEVRGWYVYIKAPAFEQEIRDHIRDTGDYGRTIV